MTYPTRVGLALAIGLSVLGSSHSAFAGTIVGKTYTMTGCAWDMWDKTRSEVGFSLMCECWSDDIMTGAPCRKSNNNGGTQSARWRQTVTGYTGSNGCVTISVKAPDQQTALMQNPPPSNDAKLCQWKRTADHRHLDWGAVATQMPDQTAVSQEKIGPYGTYVPIPTSLGTINSRYNVPNPDYSVTLSTGGTLDLFLSRSGGPGAWAVGAYDQPVMVVDGFDPANSRGPYQMWAQSPGIKAFQEKGIDVWMFNPSNGFDSIRVHADQAAYAIVTAYKYLGLNKLPLANGMSEGGIMLRIAIAGWENARSGWTSPSWFTFGTSGTAAANAIPMKAALAIDSNLLGIVGAPRQVFTDLWMAINHEISCHLPWYARLFAAVTGFVIAGPIGAAMVGLPAMLMAFKVGVDIATAQTIMTSGTFKDGIREYCPDSNPAHCTTAFHDAFYSEVNALNGNGGWPKTVKFIGVSQGDWGPNRCTVYDQWGSGTCTSAHVHTHASGELMARIDLPSYCTPSTIYAYTSSAHGDMEAGSVTELIKDILAQASDSSAGRGTLTMNFLPTYQSITDSLAMTSPTATSRLMDVAWQTNIYTHQDLDHAASTAAMLVGMVEEYSLHDGDGYIGCSKSIGVRYTLPTAASYSGCPGGICQVTVRGAVANGTLSPGKLCTCDPDDTNATVKGTCSGGAPSP